MFYIHLSCSRVPSDPLLKLPGALSGNSKKFKTVKEFKLLFLKLLTVNFSSGFLHFLEQKFDLGQDSRVCQYIPFWHRSGSSPAGYWD